MGKSSAEKAAEQKAADDKAASDQEAEQKAADDKAASDQAAGDDKSLVVREFTQTAIPGTVKVKREPGRVLLEGTIAEGVSISDLARMIEMGKAEIVSGG